MILLLCRFVLTLPLSLPLLSSTAARRLMRVEPIARVAELAQRFLSSHLPPSLRALYSLPRVGQGVLWTALTCTWMACWLLPGMCVEAWAQALWAVRSRTLYVRVWVSMGTGMT